LIKVRSYADSGSPCRSTRTQKNTAINKGVQNADPRHHPDHRRILLGIGIIATIGWILAVLGLLFLVLGYVGHPVGGRRWWY
jgi:hypothetical protein